MQQQTKPQHGQHWSLGNVMTVTSLGMWRKTAWMRLKHRRVITEDQRESLAAIIATRKGTWHETADDQRGIEGEGLLWLKRGWRRYARRWWCSATRSQGIFSKETVIGRTSSNSNDDKCEIQVNLNKNQLLHDVFSLQHRVHTLSVRQMKTSFACYKVKQQNMFGLLLIDMGNLVPSLIVSRAFWESIGGKIRGPTDY